MSINTQAAKDSRFSEAEGRAVSRGRKAVENGVEAVDGKGLGITKQTLKSVLSEVKEVVRRRFTRHSSKLEASRHHSTCSRTDFVEEHDSSR